MNKMSLACAVSMLGLASFAGTTCTWIGTSGNWNNPDNWDGGVKPTSGAGDTVVLTCASAGAVISNDMGEVSIASLTFETPNAVTLVGDPIRLTGTLFTHQAAVIDVDLYADANVGFNCGASSYDSTHKVTFNGTVVIADNKTLSVFGKSGADFYGSVTGSASTLKFGSSSYNWDGGTYCFYGPIVVDKVDAGPYPGNPIRFKNGNNHWNRINHTCSIYYYVDAEGAIPEESVINFAGKGDSYQVYRGFQLYENMTVNRIETTGTCPVIAKGGYAKNQYNWIQNKATKGVTLTLKATDNAKASCAIRLHTSDITFVYDPLGDYTQEFTDSYFDSRTSITVKGGTLKFTGDTLAQSYVTLDIRDGATFDLDVTNSEALKNVTTVKLGKNARLRIGAGAVTPFTKKPTLTMDYGAKLVIADGAAIEVGNCTTPNGLVQPVDTYTGSGASGTKASWIEGGGTVSVATSSSDYVFWKSAVDGTWDEAAKWAGDAVPAAGKPVAIARDGSSYTVTVNETPARPMGLVVINDSADEKSTLKVAAPMTVDVTAAKPLSVGAGGRIEVAEGGSLTLAASGLQADALNIRNGGELEVAGGSLGITYLPGNFNISGVEGQEGVLKISSGTCTVSSVSSVGKFLLGEYGRFAMTNGVFYCPGYTSYYRTFEFAGGTMDLSGDAQFWTAVSRTPYYGSGEINLSGNAKFCKHPTRSDAWQSRVYFEPQSETDVLAINVTEHAKYDANGVIQTDLGGSKGGTVTMRLASDQDNHVGAWGYIGTGSGYSEVKLESGSLRTGGYGLTIGGFGDEDRFSAPVHPEGRLIMSGGQLYVYADTAALPTSAPTYGLLVGCCPVYKDSSKFHGSSVVGELDISGGEVTNVYGFTLVGFGAAKGRIVQTGGFFGTSNNKPLAVGAYSGEGEWIVSNGVSQLRGQLYLGGVASNVFDRVLNSNVYPDEIAGSKGRLEVAGGTFSCYQLCAGLESCHGSAVVEVGLGGELKTWQAAKGTPALLLDNAKLVRKIGDVGTGTLLADGPVEITENASLEIDATALTDQEDGKFTLLEHTGERTGDFDAAKVTLKGVAQPDHWKLRWVGKKLKFSYAKGFSIIVR